MMRMKRSCGVEFLRCLVVAVSFAASGFAGVAQEDRSAWMKEARWGVMTHYLADWIAQAHNERMSVERWNELVDSFDAEGLAEQIKSVGAGYHLITIGQNSGYYLSPSATYDRYVGIQPSRCSRRDLVADLCEAMNERGIKLMVYLPSGPPGRDSAAAKALDWEGGGRRNREFQLKWEQVIREWSLRWGDKVVGWWFDGCYTPNAMYRFPDAPNFESFAAAARAGNPNSVVAFNPGVVDRVLSITPFEDYTAGEINDVEKTLIRRAADGKVDGARIYKLSYLGQTWGKGEPRYEDLSQVVIPWTRKIVDAGGAMTWDVPVQRNGLISEPYMEQLRAIGKGIGGLKSR